MNLLEEIANDANGIAVLKDWLGDGAKPVSQEHANHRAEICATIYDGRPCEFNCAPNWWEQHTKLKIAQWIIRELEAKNQMELFVGRENEIHMCAHCGCCLKLKVHTPIAHIRAHIERSNLTKYPSYCWIKQEIES